MSTIKKHWIFILLLWSIATSLPAEEKVITVGVEELNYSPIVNIEKEQVHGFLPDLLQLISIETGARFQIIPFPVARLKREFLHGTIDLQFPDNPKWEGSNQKKSFSMPIVSYSDSIFSIEPQKKLEVVAAPLGFTVMPEIKKRLKMVYSTDTEAMLEMLSLGRIDGIYLNSFVAKNIARSVNMKIHERTDYPIDHDYFFFSTLHHPGALEQLDDFIKSNHTLVSELREKYELEL